jgi:hypothetical protein
VSALAPQTAGMQRRETRRTARRAGRVWVTILLLALIL